MLPEDGWPTAWPGVRCGYAGGLSPENVLGQLDAIDASLPHPDAPVWIDMERRVRTDDDTALDLGRVRAVLKAVAPRVSL